MGYSDTCCRMKQAEIDALEAQLAAVRLALHPPNTTEQIDGRAVTTTHDPYYDLEGALIDLERTKADAVCIRTVRRIQGRILDAMRILQAK